MYISLFLIHFIILRSVYISIKLIFVLFTYPVSSNLFDQNGIFHTRFSFGDIFLAETNRIVY